MLLHRALNATLLLTLLLLTTLTACSAPSLWETNYTGNAAAPLAPTAPVQVRKVAFERVQGTLKELEASAAASDTHPEDWTPNQKAEARAKLLKGLQISDDPASVSVLGRSDFRTTAALRPDGPDAPVLADFARKIGATRVAWTNSYLGKADTIVQEPVTTWTDGTTWSRGRDDKHRKPSDYHESSTTWVPVRVQADEYAYIAYFLRDGAQ